MNIQNKMRLTHSVIQFCPYDTVQQQSGNVNGKKEHLMAILRQSLDCQGVILNSIIPHQLPFPIFMFPIYVCGASKQQ